MVILLVFSIYHPKTATTVFCRVELKVFMYVLSLTACQMIELVLTYCKLAEGRPAFFLLLLVNRTSVAKGENRKFIDQLDCYRTHLEDFPDFSSRTTDTQSQSRWISSTDASGAPGLDSENPDQIIIH